MKGRLLAIDGDSLAHRAYHALPKSIRGPARRRTRSSASRTSCSGSGRPSSPRACRRLGHARRADLPARGAARIPVRTRLRAVAARAARRAARARRVVRLRVGKAPGYEADDFLAAAARGGRGPVVIATSDRDAFQLVSDRVSILQPVKGVSELARIGPAEVRERYGVEPGQVGLHRAARRRLRPHPGRAGRRPEEGSVAARAVRVASTRRSPPAASRPTPTTCGSTAHRADGRGRAAAEARRDAARTGRAPPRTRRELGLNALAKRLRRARLTGARRRARGRAGRASGDERRAV